MVGGGGGDSKAADISFAGTFASSAFAACFAEICTIPLDTAKVRLQLQKKAVAGDIGIALPKYKGMLGTVATIAREEGLASLWKGIVPGLHRQCLFGGLRIGLYEPIKNLYVGDNFVGDVPLTTKILAGLTTGALAISVANPTDLVKVRLQAEGKLAPGVPRRYSGALNAYSTIVRQEGVRALWTGLGPNVARNAIINAAELASYDQVKQTILKIPGFTDNVLTHLLSGLGAGFVAVCVGSPVDVVKSRMMGDPSYKGTIDCFVKTLKNDGEPSFHLFGFLMCIGATAARALKSVLQGILLSSEGEKLNSMNLLLYMAPVAVVILLPATLIMEDNVVGITIALARKDVNIVWYLLFNSAMAYCVNLTNFLVTKHTSALTLQVLGNAKGAVAVVVSIMIFKNPVSVTGMLGYLLTVLGVILYSEAKKRTK